MQDETLKKTLPQGGLSLPDSFHPEEALSFALKDLASLAKREGKATGLAGTSSFFEKRGITPEDLPGSSVSQMISFVDSAMVDPVYKRAESVGDILNAISQDRARIQETALNQMDTMMGHGVWNDFISSNPSQAKELWNSSGMMGEPYKIPVDTPGKWDHMDIAQPRPGYTLDETHDLEFGTSDGKPPAWFVQRDILPNMTEEEKKEFLLLKDLSREEAERLSGRTPEGDAEKWVYNLPASKITDSPKFQEFAQKEWDKEMRQGSTYSRTGSSDGTTQDFYDFLRSEIKEGGREFQNEHELRRYVRDKNDELGLDFNVTEQNSVFNDLKERELATKLSPSQVTKLSETIYEVTKKGLEKENLDVENKMIFDEEVEYAIRRAEEEAGYSFHPDSIDEIMTFIDDKYFGGGKQRDKANTANWLLKSGPTILAAKSFYDSVNNLRDTTK